MKVHLWIGSNWWVVITSNDAIWESLNPCLIKEMDKQEFDELISWTLADVEDRIISILSKYIKY